MPAAAALVFVLAGTGRLEARQDNPVFVEDSPVAWELFRRTEDQVSENVGEAVRQVQELLSEYPLKLIPVSHAAVDHFTSVRWRVVELLRSNPELLERYRLIEDAEAGRLLEAGRLRELALTRPLTESGLEALLRLAQSDLERGRFHATRDWLEGALKHTDLEDRRAAHAWFMWGVASHHLEDETAAREALSRLTELGALASILQQRLGQVLDLKPVVHQLCGVTPFDQTQAVDLTELVGEDIWSSPLSETLFSRRAEELSSNRPMMSRSLEQNRAEGFLLTTAPTVAGDVVYVNQGHRVVALDRFSGLSVWGDDYIDRPAVAVIDRDDELVRDLNVVAVAENAVVTITGHAYGTTRSSDGRLVCLDPETGALRWELRFDHFGNDDDELSGLFPHSAPVISEDTVYVLARKVSPQSLTSCYVLAVNLRNGETRWIRHIVSSGAIRRAARSFSTLSVEDGDVYVASAVGAIARLDSEFGEIRWLLRFSVPMNPSPQEQTRRPWELSSHVVTADRVIALQPGQRRIAVVDRETGSLQASFDAVDPTRWNSPAYLLANDRHVFAVGREIHAFELHALDQMVWKLPDYERSAADRTAPELTPMRMEIRGRVQLVDDALIVPTESGVVIVESETGRVLHQMALDAPGNPLAVDSQLIVAGHDHVDAFMSLRRAKEMLRHRIASSPDNPESPLSLVRLAIRVGDLDLVHEGAQAAMTAIRLNRSESRSRDAQARLFSMLLDADVDQLIHDDEAGERYFAVINSIVTDAAQRVAYLFAYGDWLGNHDTQRAIEAYQTILSEPNLAQRSRIEKDVRRPAAAHARDRLAAMLREHGLTLYAAQADFAAVKLEQLRAARPIEPERLFALSREFPFAPAAADAAILGAERTAAEGDENGAIAGLAEAIRAVHVDLPQRGADELRLTLMTAYIRLSLDLGERALAEDALRVLVQQHGNPTLPVPGDDPAAPPRTRTAREWLASLGALSAPPRPDLGDAEGEAQVLRGTIIPFHLAATIDRSEPRRPLDAILLQDGQTIRLVDGRDLETRWTTNLDGAAPRLLLHDTARVLLWRVENPERPQAVMIDAADGSLRWTTPDLRDHLSDAPSSRGPEPEVASRIRMAMPGGEAINPGEVLPIVDRDRLCLVRRTGGVAAFALDDGRHPAWVRQQTLDEVHHAMIHEGRLILAGLHRRSGDAGRTVRVPMLMVIDAESGRVLHGGAFPAPECGDGIRWMRGGPFGLLIYASDYGLAAIDLHSANLVWAMIAPGELNTVRGWVVGDSMLIELAGESPTDTPRGAIRAVRLRDGRLGKLFEQPDSGDWEPLNLLGVEPLEGDEALVHYRQRLARYGLDGQIRGLDVIRDDRAFIWSFVGRDRLVLVSAMQPLPEEEGGQFGRRMQYVFRIYQLSPNCRLLAEPLQLPPLAEPLQDAATINDWLLLSTMTSTVAVPMPAVPRVQPPGE